MRKKVTFSNILIESFHKFALLQGWLISNSLQFRLLRTACRDYTYSKGRIELARVCKRATPFGMVKICNCSKGSKNELG